MDVQAENWYLTPSRAMGYSGSNCGKGNYFWQLFLAKLLAEGVRKEIESGPASRGGGRQNE